MALLEMRQIEKHFGPVIALGGVSFDVRAGECHCLLGDNGAGKSTFIKTMAGVHRPSRGKMLVEGTEVTFDSPRDAMAAGIASSRPAIRTATTATTTASRMQGRMPRFPMKPRKRLTAPDWARP